jgi:hypothetical protein
VATANFATLVDNLISTLKAAVSLAGIPIYDGMEVDESYPGNAIAIGHDGSFGDAEMQIANVATPPFAFGNILAEDGVITCCLWSESGTTGFSARRIKALSLLSNVDTAIRAASTLSGAAFFSHVDGYRVAYRQTTSGSAVILVFSIAYQSQS